jgi:hypothetical protein
MVAGVSAVIFAAFRVMRMWSRGHREQTTNILNRTWPGVFILLLLFLILLVYFAATADDFSSLRAFLLTISSIAVTLGYLFLFLRRRS